MIEELPKPDYTRNMRLLGYSDQGGRPDGVQIMVAQGHAYIGHMFSKGFSIVDVRDPRHLQPVNYVPAPPGTWNIHLQTHDNLLLVVNAKDMFAAAEFADERAYYRGAIGATVGTAESAPSKRPTRDWTAGLTVYDISQPAMPRQIGFLPLGHRAARKHRPSARRRTRCDECRRHRRVGRHRAGTVCTMPSSMAISPMALGATPDSSYLSAAFCDFSARFHSSPDAV
jgi:hypothetical protein